MLRADATLSTRPPRNVFAGYPVFVPLGLEGVPDRTPVTVERRSGGRWRAAGETIALGERGEAVVTLPRGKTRLRTVAQLGDELVTSPAVAVSVRRARGWVTGARDDGRYSGRTPGERSVRLRIARGGREVRGFTAQVPMLCPTQGMVGQFTTQIGTAAIRRARIAPDGRFVGVATPDRSTSIRVRGKLRRRGITGGRVELSVGACQGSAAFSARRTGS